KTTPYEAAMNADPEITECRLHLVDAKDGEATIAANCLISFWALGVPHRVSKLVTVRVKYDTRRDDKDQVQVENVVIDQVRFDDPAINLDLSGGDVYEWLMEHWG